MSLTRDALNIQALTRMLGGRPPPGTPEPLQLAAPGAGAAAAQRPIDWESPDTVNKLFADATDGETIVRLRNSCGSEILININAAGAAQVRVINCSGNGYKLTPDGLVKVSVDGDGTETEEGSPLGVITVEACVDGVTRTLNIVGYIS